MEPIYIGTRDEQQYFLTDEGNISSRPLMRRRIRAAQGCKMITGVLRYPEIWIAGYLSGDPFLADAAGEGVEPYTYIASSLLGAPYSVMREAFTTPQHPKHTKVVKLRSITEILTLGVLNGIDPLRLASITGESVSAIAKLIIHFHRKALLLSRWLRANVSNTSIVEATRRALFGRTVENFERATGGVEALRPSAPTSGGSVSSALPRPRISHKFHDAIVVECPAAFAGTANNTGPIADILQRSMRCASDETLPQILFDPTRQSCQVGGPPMRIDIRVGDSCKKRS
jgi:hypothetical protein